MNQSASNTLVRLITISIYIDTYQPNLSTILSGTWQGAASEAAVHLQGFRFLLIFILLCGQTCPVTKN